MSDLVDLPKPVKKEMKVLFLKKKHQSVLRLQKTIGIIQLYVLALTTGLRQGEHRAYYI